MGSEEYAENSPYPTGPSSKRSSFFPASNPSPLRARFGDNYDRASGIQKYEQLRAEFDAFLSSLDASGAPGQGSPAYGDGSSFSIDHEDFQTPIFHRSEQFLSRGPAAPLAGELSEARESFSAPPPRGLLVLYFSPNPPF